jgi:hypothetical protein
MSKKLTPLTDKLCNRLGFATINADLLQHARRMERERDELSEALQAITCWSSNGEQLCFRTSNGVPMGMTRKLETIARAALRLVRKEQ